MKLIIIITRGRIFKLDTGTLIKRSETFLICIFFSVGWIKLRPRIYQHKLYESVKQFKKD